MVSDLYLPCFQHMQGHDPMNPVPNISGAMAPMQSLADAIESRGVAVPTEAEVLPVLSFARASAPSSPAARRLRSSA